MPQLLANNCLWLRTPFYPFHIWVLATIKIVYVSSVLLFVPDGTPCPYSGPSGLRLCLQVRSSYLSHSTLGISALYLTVIFALWPTFSSKMPLARGIPSCVQPIGDLGPRRNMIFPAITCYCFSL
ncbi:hypothetical protein K443DRAFT_293743 [Laccaria amethystina LaAM-08-1]|uniref:Uncharacterized protein n=1 Tax=Laccaria amethystina LaAM-08-1 TaxID=1095629 RepID=A0A0C9XJ12_9AGAR|nr:hypothetical protein K443DRAFT_293743 [Laccaria amethystina LaAM-08-1]